MITHSDGKSGVRYGQGTPPYGPGQTVEIVNSDDPEIPVGIQADVAEVVPSSDDPDFQEAYPSGWMVGVRNPYGAGGIVYVDAGDVVRLAAVETYPAECAQCGAVVGESEVPYSHGLCEECQRALFEAAELTPDELVRLEEMRSRRRGGSEMETRRGTVGSRPDLTLNRITSRLSRRGRYGSMFDRFVANLHVSEERVMEPPTRRARMQRRAQPPFVSMDKPDVDIGLGGGMGENGMDEGPEEEPITPDMVDLDTVTPEHLDAIEEQVSALESELAAADEDEAAKAVGEAGESLGDADEAMGEEEDGDEGPPEFEEESGESPTKEELEAEARLGFLTLQTRGCGYTPDKKKKKKV